MLKLKNSPKALIPKKSFCCIQIDFSIVVLYSNLIYVIATATYTATTSK